MTEWQPIETAPKDGTWFLAYVPPKAVPKGKDYIRFYGRRFLTVHWATPPEDNAGLTIGKRARFLEGLYDGFWSTNPHNIRPIHGKPSHWMPLPEPPK